MFPPVTSGSSSLANLDESISTVLENTSKDDTKKQPVCPYLTQMSTKQNNPNLYIVLMSNIRLDKIYAGVIPSF